MVVADLVPTEKLEDRRCAIPRRPHEAVFGSMIPF